MYLKMFNDDINKNDKILEELKDNYDKILDSLIALKIEIDEQKSTFKYIDAQLQVFMQIIPAFNELKSFIKDEIKLLKP